MTPIKSSFYTKIVCVPILSRTSVFRVAHPHTPWLQCPPQLCPFLSTHRSLENRKQKGEPWLVKSLNHLQEAKKRHRPCRRLAVACWRQVAAASWKNLQKDKRVEVCHYNRRLLGNQKAAYWQASGQRRQLWNGLDRVRWDMEMRGDCGWIHRQAFQLIKTSAPVKDRSPHI